MLVGDIVEGVGVVWVVKDDMELRFCLFVVVVGLPVVVFSEDILPPLRVVLFFEGVLDVGRFFEGVLDVGRLTGGLQRPPTANDSCDESREVLLLLALPLVSGYILLILERRVLEFQMGFFKMTLA